MTSISDTLARLAKQRGPAGHPPAGPARLTDLGDFGANPGALAAKTYIPATLPAAGGALVVVLHGCTQTAEGYDRGAGWSQLAERDGFALLFPEQVRANNPNLCFNWFVPEDCRRDGGEAASIRQMIARVAADRAIDPARIYVTGLSAGGAMTSVMLATWPELFAGGAIIAGLPFGTTDTMSQALQRMGGHGLPGEAELAGLARRASGHAGPWPTISVWHGTADATVAPANAEAILGQWRALHGVERAAARADTVDGYPHRVWHDRAGRAVIEEYSITGMGHGTPLDTLGADGCGARAPHMLEAGISSTMHIARFWGLSGPAGAARAVEPQAAPPLPRTRAPTATVPPPQQAGGGVPPRQATGVGRVIEDALRAAGLMK